MSAAKGTAKVLQKLEKSVSEGNYYEAHQMYRTVANRYVKAHNYADAIKLLRSGALLLLQHKQVGSGTDLALYMVEVYNLDKVPVTEESRDRIFDLADLMDSENSQRKTFLQNAISQAEAHLLVGTKESAEALGLVLFEWSELEPSHDKGAYLLRGVLQELAMRNLRDAHVVYSTFVERLPATYLSSDQKSPDGVKTIKTYKSSLINLTQMLLLACQTGNPAIFKQVAAKYKPVLAIDENFGALMTAIGELFFNIRAPKQTNMLADLMSSLFSGPPAASSRPALGSSGSQPQPAIEEMD
ncbi:hypothetical protein BG000_007334 [Podila horticola]|nr:hypothetical protein BG000_007334 [Podila horticola]